MQSNPVVVDGVLYVTTPTLKVGGGRTRRPDARSGSSIRAAAARRRAVPPSRRHRSTSDRVFVSYRSFSGRSTAKTGAADRVVRRRGRIDLREGLDRPADRLSVSASTPGVVFEDMLIIGSSVPETLPGIAGPHPRVRREHRQAALDLPHHSAAGRIRLRHVAEGGLPARPAAPTRGRASPWIARLGMVFAATGSASFDFYGVTRHGDNLFADCVLALDARDRHARLALPGHQARRLGLRLPCRAEPRHRHAQRTPRRRGRADHEATATSTCSIDGRASRCFRSNRARCRRRRSTASGCPSVSPTR